MKRPRSIAVMFLIILAISSPTSSRHITKRRLGNVDHDVTTMRIDRAATDKENQIKPEMQMEKRGVLSPRKPGPDTLQVAGSSLPDCSHACGSCRPCRLVMVSFVCASLEEAETCPMAYRCMCRNKSYPVP